MSKNNNIKVIIVKVNKKNEYDDKSVINLTTIIFWDIFLNIWTIQIFTPYESK